MPPTDPVVAEILGEFPSDVVDPDAPALPSAWQQDRRARAARERRALVADLVSFYSLTLPRPTVDEREERVPGMFATYPKGWPASLLMRSPLIVHRVDAAGLHSRSRSEDLRRAAREAALDVLLDLRPLDRLAAVDPATVDWALFDEEVGRPHTALGHWLTEEHLYGRANADAAHRALAPWADALERTISALDASPRGWSAGLLALRDSLPRGGGGRLAPPDAYAMSGPVEAPDDPISALEWLTSSYGAHARVDRAELGRAYVEADSPGGLSRPALYRAASALWGPPRKIRGHYSYSPSASSTSTSA